LIGGAIVEGLNWSAIFWVNVPIGLLLLVLGRLRLAETWGDRRPLDWPGIALVGSGLFGIVYGLVRGGADGWGSPRIVGALVAGGLLLAAFLLRERTARHPLIDIAFFGRRGFSVANVVGFLMTFGMFGSIFFITLFVQEVRGASPLRAGLQTMPWTGTIMLVAPLAGIVAGRIGSRLPLILGMASQAIALAWLGLAAEATTPYLHLLPAFILGGLGMGLAFAPLSNAVMAAIPGTGQGQASGVYNTVRELGGVFGVAVLGAVFQHLVTSPDHFTSAFHTVLLIGAAVLAGGTAIAALLPTTLRPVVEEFGALPVPAGAD
jgi:MFS family permease